MNKLSRQLHSRASRQGMALISVLAVLLLLTLLVVAFMTRATSSRTSANLYHSTVSTRLLAQTAVNFVQAQIHEATTYGLSGSTPTYTWGSQPGAIRVFDGTGNLTSIYRLYSASTAGGGNVRTASSLTQLAADLPNNSNWSSFGAQWVDINAAVQDNEGKYHFPILDPRDPGASQTANPTTVATLWHPSSGALALKGFSVQTPSNIGTSVSPAPMPVRWLYMLKDGSMVTPDSPSSSSNTLTFTSGGAHPSVANPIVGRIAFWTDDDSSKININTAAGDDVIRQPTPIPPAAGYPLPPVLPQRYASNSTFWATPVFSALDEEVLALYQPLHDEYQRYPGHPGTVGLNTTLSTLIGLSTPMSDTDFFSLLPRYVWGGSKSATVYVPDTGAQAALINIGSNRLYTSVEEMLFNATNRTASAIQTDSPSDAAQGVERANFFLTAHSSSSELNLFGEPRVSIWPITGARSGFSAAASQTATDILLAYDSTIPQTVGGGPALFYFQRIDPTSSVTDCNIGNNMHILSYLNTLTSTPIPGFGGPLSTKYPGGLVSTSTHQILSEIFDYVRTINMQDPQWAATVNKSYGQDWGRAGSAAGRYQVVPSVNGGAGVNGWGTQGIGSFPYPVEVSIHFAALGVGYQPPITDAGGNVIRPGQPEWNVPPEVYNDPNVAHDNQGTTDRFTPEIPPTIPATPNTASPEFDTLTMQPVTATIPGPPPGAQYYNTLPIGPAGRPADWTTAMQAFVYVSFINPAVLESSSQPIFCYSIKGLNNITVTDPVGNLPIPLQFPGNATGQGPINDEERTIVDNSNGSGFLNGYIGDWIFGYIPLQGELGQNNYNNSNPAMLSPQQTKWGITNSVAIANGTATGRQFPFYSQLFCISGQQQDLYPRENDPTLWAPTNSATPVPNTYKIIPVTPYPASFTGGTPSAVHLLNPNPTGQFGFSGATISIKMYDASMDGQNLASSNVVSTYTVTFPPASFFIPTYKQPWVVNSPVVNTTPPNPPGPAWYYQNHIFGCQGNVATDRWHSGVNYKNGNFYYQDIIAANDTVESMTLSPIGSDARDLASYANPPNVFAQHPNYGSNITANNLAHGLLADSSEPVVGNHDPTNFGRLLTQTPLSSFSYAPATFLTPLQRMAFVYNDYPLVPPRLNGPLGQGLLGEGAYTSNGLPGDWDNGIASYPDGPWVNMADEGALTTNEQQGGVANSVAYFSTGNTAQKVGIATTFSPNREVPSPVMFGSLPTGIIPGQVPHPWQTLLFRPGPHAGGFPSPASHPGEANIASGVIGDHMFLDLFWMPQAEPYPISQPFVTAGKINLNYEIQPFTYITRDTALRALLGSEEIAVMPSAAISRYKVTANPTGVTASQITAGTSGMDSLGNSRLPIDVDQTLGLNPDTTQDPHAPTGGNTPVDTAQSNSGGVFNAWYDSQAKTTRFFKSESEICEMFLVPQGYDWQEFSGATFNSHSWYSIPVGDFALVGDNTRERPYANLYSRLTTKSNTYTVYYTVQSLKNSEGPTDAAQGTWDETKGTITGELRGSSIIERYLDSNEKLPDYLGSTSAFTSLEPYYKWRVLETRQFAP